MSLLAGLLLPILATDAGVELDTEVGVAPALGVAAGFAWGDGLTEAPALAWTLTRVTARARLGAADAAIVGVALGRSYMLGGVVVEIDGGLELGWDGGGGPAAGLALRYGPVGVSTWSFVHGPDPDVGLMLGISIDVPTLVSGR